MALKGSIGLVVFGILLGMFAMRPAGCARDRRPDEWGARMVFGSLYPRVEFDSVWVSEDEVEARSFAFRYLRSGQTERRTIEIQFMEGPQGAWIASPPAPDTLP